MDHKPKKTKLTARATDPCELTNYGYGDFTGVKITVMVDKTMRWSAEQKNGYWFLTRKGVTLRLTHDAFRRLFYLEDQSAKG